MSPPDLPRISQAPDFKGHYAVLAPSANLPPLSGVLEVSGTVVTASHPQAMLLGPLPAPAPVFTPSERCESPRRCLDTPGLSSQPVPQSSVPPTLTILPPRPPHRHWRPERRAHGSRTTWHRRRW